MTTNKYIFFFFSFFIFNVHQVSQTCFLRKFENFHFFLFFGEKFGLKEEEEEENKPRQKKKNNNLKALSRLNFLKGLFLFPQEIIFNSFYLLQESILL